MTAGARASLAALLLLVAPAAEAEGPPQLPELVWCAPALPPPVTGDGQWRHSRSALVAASGDPGHVVQDVLAPPGADVVVGGKLAYGPLSKDLEDEDVTLRLYACKDGWRTVGRGRTDDDGRVRITVPAGDLPPVGRHRLHLSVDADGSGAGAALRLLPRGTRLMVFDIDGTLTSADVEAARGALSSVVESDPGELYMPENRPGAVDVTRTRHARQGYELVYLSGRPYLMAGLTRYWLKAQGFAPGHVHITDRNRDVLPTSGGVATFKARYLESLDAMGFVVTAAYGNATTDIEAYGRAGLRPDRTYILGKHGGGHGTVALGDDFEVHNAAIGKEPAAAQPFTR